MSYDFNFDGTMVKVMLDYDKDEKSDYCQIETRQRRKIPLIIRNDFDIFEELNDVDNLNYLIFKPMNDSSSGHYFGTLINFDITQSLSTESPAKIISLRVRIFSEADCIQSRNFKIMQ